MVCVISGTLRRKSGRRGRMLELRITHVKPGYPTKVWDAKMMDGRKDTRVFPNGEHGDATEFIEINVLRNDDSFAAYYPAKYTHTSPVKGISTTPISKSQRRKITKMKNNGKQW